LFGLDVNLVDDITLRNKTKCFYPFRIDFGWQKRFERDTREELVVEIKRAQTKNFFYNEIYFVGAFLITF
jgi:hypothetical protein